MLTELKKTIHIVVKDMKTVPDERMIGHAIRTDMNPDHHRPDDRAIHDEYGYAVQEAARMTSEHAASYHVWSVDMRFTRDCKYEPKVGQTTVDDAELARVVAHLLEALQSRYSRQDQPAFAALLKNKVRELIEDGMLSIVNTKSDAQTQKVG